VTVYDDFSILHFVNKGYESCGNLITNREEEKRERVLPNEAPDLVKVILPEIVRNIHDVPWHPLINSYAEFRNEEKMGKCS
jgi:hypothetical protein